MPDLMWNLGPLVPVALLGGGAALCLRAKGPSPARGRIAIVASLLALVVATGTALYVGRNGALSLSLVGWPNPPFALAPALDLSAAPAVTLIVVAGLSLLTSVAARGGDDSLILVRVLAVAAASSLFVGAMSNPLGLVLAWSVLDIVLFLSTAYGRRGLLTSHAGLLLAVVGFASLPSGLVSLADGSGTQIGPAVPWLIGAAAVRTGLFPAWWSVPPSDHRQQWSAITLRLGPMICGLSLAIYVAGRAGTLAVPLSAVAVGVTAAAAGGLLSTLRGRHSRSLDWSAGHHAAIVVLAAFVGGRVGVSIALLLMLDFVVTRACLYLPAEPWREQRWARGVAWASALGLPLTAGFAGRWLLYQELLAQEAYAVLLLVGAATLLAVAGPLPGDPILRPEAEPEPEPMVWLRRVPAPLLAIVILALGIGAGELDFVLVPLGGAPLANPIRSAFMLATEPTSARTGLILLLAMVVPATAGVVAALTLGRGLEAAPRARAGRALELTVPAARAMRGLILTGAALHRITGLVEGRRAMALTLVSAIAVGLLPFERTLSPGAQPNATFVVAYLVAAGLGVTLLLSPAPAVTLGALTGAYVLSGALLFATGTTLYLVAIKVFAGLLVVTMLGIGVIQSPDAQVPGGARRLRDLRTPTLVRTPLAVLAFMVAAVAIIGVVSETFPDRLPTTVLQPALLMAAGGAVAIVFARAPLRLSTGVFFALVAFDMVYARLDSGLVITGGIAAFQLLLAVVASYFVGLGLNSAAAPSSR